MMNQFFCKLHNKITILLIKRAINRVHGYPFNGYKRYNKEKEVLENLGIAIQILESLDWQT